MQAAELTMTHELEALFAPRAIAVVGASGNERSPIARPFQYLQDYGFQGPVYPVNSKYETLRGATCYPDLESLPGPIDLALMMVPAASVFDMLPQVAQAGAKAAVVFAAGYGEAGDEGVVMQRELVEAGRRYGVRILGPNCQGVVAPASHLYGTFTLALESGPVEAGGLAYVGQSGAVGGSVLSMAREQGIGISAWASTGNQADLDTVEVAQYLVERDDTTTVALYLESSVAEVPFRDLARRTKELGKSLIILRSGVSSAGARAAASHTGAIIGSDASLHATIQEYGVVEVHDIDELVHVANAHTALPYSQGNSMVVVTTSGGAGSLSADHAEIVGLQVPVLGDKSQERLAGVVPSFGTTENPIDVSSQIFRGGDADEFVKVCQVALELEETDSLLIVLTVVTGELAHDMANSLVDLMANAKKPVAVVWAAAREQTQQARQVLRSAGVPVFDSSSQATRALSTLVRAECSSPKQSLRTDLDNTKIESSIAELHGVVTEGAAAELLSRAGIPRPQGWVVQDASEVDHLQLSNRERYVVKIQSPHILHKTDRGGVSIGIEAANVPAVVGDMLTKFADEKPEGVLIQHQAQSGIELIVGATRSGPEGLPLITVGLGGTATELYGDTSTAFAPVGISEARELLLDLKAAPLLTGYRGSDPVDLDAVADLVSRLSYIAAAAGPRLKELEINPVRVSADNGTLSALDFLMILDEEVTV